MTSALPTHPSAASYAASGYAQRMGWGPRPALLIVDACTAYWDASSPLDTSANPSAAAAPASMRRLVAAARAGGAPVVWTRVAYAADGGMRDAGLFWLKSRVLDVWRAGDARGLGGWVDGLAPREGEVVVEKRYPSAFFATDLATRLQVERVDTVVVCGVSTSGCVRASALDAMQYGYRPMVVGEACGDRSMEIHNANLFDLDAKYADVVTEEEAVEKLKAGWPKSEN